MSKSPYDVNLPYALICDIDGTLALNTSGRSPYDWSRVGEDTLNAPIAEIVTLYSVIKNCKILFVSGRDEVCKLQTFDWLKKHGFYRNETDALLMRPEGNNEKDSVIKERIYRDHIEGKYNVRFVLDDRNQVVRMWRDLGLTCLQVADGAF